MEVPPKEKTANVEGGSMMGCALNDYLNLEENLHRNVQLLQRLLGVEENVQLLQRLYIFYMHSSEDILELPCSAISIALFHLGRHILQGNCIQEI